MSMTEARPLIAAQEISIYRYGKALLDRVSLQVNAGDNITIIGPNGAGKTLLLKTLLGAVKPDEGAVTRADDLTIGYMPQALQLNNLLPMNVGRFLRLTSRDGALIAKVLTEVGAPDVTEYSLHTLSGGQMQRVLLARALLMSPDLLVLDEPAQNLDVSGQVAIYRLIHNIQKQRGCAVLMVSHDLHLVMRDAQKVVCLFHHICCSGAPEEIISTNAFSELYGEDFSSIMAYYPHMHDHNHGHADGGCDHDHGGQA